MAVNEGWVGRAWDAWTIFIRGGGRTGKPGSQPLLSFSPFSSQDASREGWAAPVCPPWAEGGSTGRGQKPSCWRPHGPCPGCWIKAVMTCHVGCVIGPRTTSWLCRQPHSPEAGEGGCQGWSTGRSPQAEGSSGWFPEPGRRILPLRGRGCSLVGYRFPTRGRRVRHHRRTRAPAPIRYTWTHTRALPPSNLGVSVSPEVARSQLPYL